MDSKVLIDGLISYIGLVVLLTFHEFGHAWMAWKCGDDTAKSLGRCSLNPLVHIEPIGTVLIPLIQIFAPGAGQYLLGWAKPVPVNLLRLRNPRMDDILVSMAGPWMNLALAVVLMGLARLGMLAGLGGVVTFGSQTALISLLLFFFNLIPIPPLDGSRVLRVLIGMSYETYWNISRFGFIAIILVLQIEPVTTALYRVTRGAWLIVAGWSGVPV